MNTARKIESDSYPLFRRQSDRVRAVNLAVQQVERGYSAHRRRMVLILAAAAALLVVNGILITQLG